LIQARPSVSPEDYRILTRPLAELCVDRLAAPQQKQLPHRNKPSYVHFNDEALAKS